MTHLELISIFYDSYSISTLADATRRLSYLLSSTIIRTAIIWRNGRFLFGSTYLAASRRHGCDLLNSMVIRTDVIVRNVRFLLGSISDDFPGLWFT
jgi:hypothetical protein